MYLTNRPSRKKKAKVRNASERIQKLQEPKLSLQPIRRYEQKTIYEGFGIPIPESGDPGIAKIIPSGDELIEKEDGILRWALQNPNGIRLKDNVDVLPEVSAIERLQIDVAAFPESKLVAHGRTKEVLQTQLNVRIGSAYVRNAAAPRRISSNSEYQPGGVLTAATGRVTGRILKSGTDPWGRFTWILFRGNRDEGILFISAYRVCQKKEPKLE
jgi:hypothetical protein